MAILKEKDGGRESLLEVRSLVGRSPAGSIVLEDRGVSGEHARIHWTGRRWELRDLGSRNGTWVNGRSVEPGREVPLGEGDAVAFGDPRRLWVLVDASAPTATARRVRDGALRAAEDSLLVLPEPDRVEVTLYEGPDGRWLLEDDGETRAVEDYEVLTVAGDAWTLQLPEPGDPTLRSEGRVLNLADMVLRFTVSSDEEHVDLHLVGADETRRMPPRRYHYMLLTLARERLRDMANPDISDNDHGWMHAEDLCRMLDTDDNRLNVDIYRSRKELAALGIHGATGLIERRRTSRQLRIGTDRLDVPLPGESR